MSHFVVLVLGDEIEAQLEPYYEGLDTDPYKSYTVSAEGERMVDHWPLHYVKKLREGYAEKSMTGKNAAIHPPRPEVPDPATAPLEEIAAFLNAEFGTEKPDEGFEEQDTEYYHVDESGMYQWSHYNPNSKWDWYQIGGRWAGELLLKPGGVGVPGEKSWGIDGDPYHEHGREWTDQCYLADIDWDGMRELAITDAKARYAVWETKVLEIKNHAGEYEEKFQKHAEDPSPFVDREGNVLTVEQLEERFILNLRWEYGVDPGQSLEDYLERYERPWTPYAMLVEGEWYGRGEMGWFGFSSDDKDGQEWADMVERTLKDAPPDTLVTIVDCHI